MDDREARERVGRVESLLEGVETLADPVARDMATDVAQALLDLYGEGLDRIVAAVADRDDGTLAEALASDELVSHLLLLHGLHPVPLGARVRDALEEVRPYLASHDGDVELLGIEDGVVRLRLEGSCSGCPSSRVTLKLAIEEAIHKAAPDVREIVAEGAVEEAPSPPGLVQLQMAPPAPPPLQIDGAWAIAEGVDGLDGGPLVTDVAGEPVLFVRLKRSTYAYRPVCPGCGGSLRDAVFGGGELACAACGKRYDVRRAGRCLAPPDLHLDPVPLLVDAEGHVKVALGSAA